MKFKTISKFGIIFAVTATMVTTAVFTACSSDDDFGGDITGEYTLATRAMTRAGENNDVYNDEDSNKQHEDTLDFKIKADFNFKVCSKNGTYLHDFTESEYYNVLVMTDSARTYFNCCALQDSSYPDNIKINIINCDATISAPNHYVINLQAAYDNTFGDYPSGYTFSIGYATYTETRE